MGTKGKRNTPITARVNAGLFNQKKGITEPLLNVGPAGVYGDNQTRDIPSPSKIKGYSMKASPFKQAKVKADEGDIKVITTEKGKDTTKKVTVPGTPGTENLDKLNKGKKDLGPDFKPTQAQTDAANKEVADAKAKDIAAAKPTEKTVVVKGKDTERKRPVQTKDTEDTQTARERSNTVRGGKRMNRKERQAQKKIDRLNRKSGAIDPSTIKKDKVTGKDIEGSGTKYDRKKQKNARLMKEAEDNKKLASASSEGAQRQAEQNRSISARKTGTLKSNERDLRESDATSDTTKKLVDTQLGVNATTKAETNPTEIAGVPQEAIDGVDKKTPGFFKTKSPMKKNYFK
tara:strand:+ start:87 stop:1121 length:1035 start_codon:yes stop_codon:yes gene_type:complete